MLWSGDLIDVQKFSNRGVDLYIRLPSLELGKLVFHIDHDGHNLEDSKQSTANMSVFVSLLNPIL
ncbi:hypothetical protein Gotur_006313 [Gossypium turneri]